MKEYLTKNSNGEYQLVNHRFSDDDVEVPEGAECLTKCNADGEEWFLFWMENCKWCVGFDNEWVTYQKVELYIEDWDGRASIVWQRTKDNVNHPSHYTQGGIECIDAIQASMTKEAFCGYLKGNIQKYMWRYEHKGGLESVKKAKWYIDKLIAIMEDKDS